MRGFFFAYMVVLVAYWSFSTCFTLKLSWFSSLVVSAIMTSISSTVFFFSGFSGSCDLCVLLPALLADLAPPSLLAPTDAVVLSFLSLAAVGA